MKFGPALQLVTALALAAGVAPLCAGQQSTRGTRPDSTQRELQRTFERDLLYKQMQEMMARGPSRRPTRRPPLTQINEDFTRIQVVNRALAQAVAAGDELDFKLVARAASEIKKRAGRLKQNLALPEADGPRPRAAVGAESGQLKAALGALDGLVISFVSNPGFRSVDVIDARWSVKARRDLEEIIELSGRVKTCSEQLHKAAQRPR